MTARYLADAEALNHYLFDALPPAASDVFDRGEAGIDTIETPDVQLMETLFSAARSVEVAGYTFDVEPQVVLVELVRDGPVDLLAVDLDELGVYGSVAKDLTMHDAVLVAAYQRRDVDAVLTSDEAIDTYGVDTIWE
jgi:predicted nucleic acid-binding protein